MNAAAELTFRYTAYDGKVARSCHLPGADSNGMTHYEALKAFPMRVKYRSTKPIKLTYVMFRNYQNCFRAEYGPNN
jgi:hypothetical protein